MVGTRGRTHEGGQDLVEFALILPLLLVLLIAIVDFSLAFFSYNSIANGAREGARYGVIHPDDAAGIQARALASAIGLDQAAVTVNVACADINAATIACTDANAATVSVTASYDYHLITGPMVRLFGASAGVLNLRALATMRLEGR